MKKRQKLLSDQQWELILAAQTGTQVAIFAYRSFL
jgi:hypothetical protein